MTSQRSRVSSRAAGGRVSAPSPVATIPLRSSAGSVAPERGRSSETSQALPEGADALSGSFPIFPTILCAQSPMARQDPRLVARSSSVSPAIPSRSGVEG